MSYGMLNSPLPGLTVSSTGERRCGMRGYQPGAHALLGDDSIDYTDMTSLIDPYSAPVDTGILTDLPLPNQLSPSLESLYPTIVGTEFTSNGDGTYTNIQTGQTVPYSIAEQITQATAPVAVDTTPTGQGPEVTIQDPNTGATSSISTNNLTAAAQALQAAGQLVNAAGQLTSQGRALLNGGNLYRLPPSTGISGAMSSLTSWMTGSTLFPGVPNLAVIGGAVVLVMVLPSIMQRKKRR
jgi:hypothetical protein